MSLGGRALGQKLLGENALLQAAAPIELQRQRVLATGLDMDVANVTDFLLIGNRRDRALDRFQHAKADLGIVGQDGAAPASRA